MPQIDYLFDSLLSMKGSDLHLGVGYPPLARARGELVAMRDDPVTTEEMESLLFEIVNAEQKKQILETLDLDFAYAYADKARFRANYFYKQTGLGAVFRTIPTKVLTLQELGTPDSVRKMADRRSGLCLVTGPTGSGKSTTLAGMINHINETRACHILTIEDPVEFVHKPKRSQVTHREVGPHVSNFATAIRSAGREDPNVILIGELRTNETMKLALQLASFGILVFATVHTNSAPATIDRIINAFPADEQPQVRGMLAEGLAGIVAQQLLKTADGKGRVAALEILVGNSAIAALIREGKSFQIPSIMQGGQAQGMQTMDMALERLVTNKVVEPEVALEKASDKEAFGRFVQRFKGGPPGLDGFEGNGGGATH
ncbi:MAG TPA: type IV pilus twitching motility protein PilT [Polyangiaceae bacterium]